MKRWLGWGAAAALTLGGAGYGVTQTARSISATEKAAGAKAHPALLQEFGGVYSGPQAAYVTTVGQRIAVRSGLANSQREFTVTLLDSPVDNAFAIPGGYVYVTRQLMALMNDEAQLAAVLGHEVGHVAARHAASRQRTSTITSVLTGLLGMATGSSAIGQIAGVGGQALTARFSRGQETQADDLAVRYLAGAGYDPYATADMLAALGAQTSLDQRAKGSDARSGISWFNTHPNSGDRVKRALAQAARMGVARGERPRDRDAFIMRLDGMRYGEDPSKGVVDGQSFRHPVLKLGFTVPAGYSITNGDEAVSITGPAGQAQFRGGAIGTGLDAYVDGVFRALGANGQTPAVTRTRINGMEAAVARTRAVAGSTPADVTAVAYAFSPGRAYHFLLLTAAGRGSGPFGAMVESFGKLSDAEAAAIKGRRISVVTVKPGDTVAGLAARMAYPDYKVERFVTLNALDPRAPLTPGRKVKLVVYG